MSVSTGTRPFHASCVAAFAGGYIPVLLTNVCGTQLHATRTASALRKIGGEAPSAVVIVSTLLELDISALVPISPRSPRQWLIAWYWRTISARGDLSTNCACLNVTELTSPCFGARARLFLLLPPPECVCAAGIASKMSVREGWDVNEGRSDPGLRKTA
ncbi:hypothetical protein B0H12DRAFT_1097115 [Mycena haematopus]|nr:hypothetical protein B0H12DRAFT_1097115 [Mycena haematopus]